MYPLASQTNIKLVEISLGNLACLLNPYVGQLALGKCNRLNFFRVIKPLENAGVAGHPAYNLKVGNIEQAMQSPAVNDLLQQRKRRRAVGVANLAHYKHIAQRLAHHADNQPLCSKYRLTRASAAVQHNISVLVIVQQRQICRVKRPFGDINLHPPHLLIVQNAYFA